MSFRVVSSIILTQDFYNIGGEAKEQYGAVPTEWTNIMKYNVLYAPKDSTDKSLPPILVEIQPTLAILSTKTYETPLV